MGVSLAFSNVVASQAQPVASAGQVHPDKKKGVCDKGSACTIGENDSYGLGVYGSSAEGAGGEFENAAGGEVGLYGYDGSGAGFPIVRYSATGDEMYTDEDGDGIFDGYVYAAGGFEDVIHARGGQALKAFGATSTRATLEDTGTARLEDGEGAVRFDAAFARSIDTSSGYQVFLTPDGDTRVLYVAAKYGAGFVVRETMRGRSSLDFDYRVVAHPAGASLERLPVLHLERPPAPKPQ